MSITLLAAPERVIATVVASGESLSFADGTFRLGGTGETSRQWVQEADAAGVLHWSSPSERAWFRWLFIDTPVAPSVSAATRPGSESFGYRLGSLVRSTRQAVQVHPFVSIGIAALLEVLFRASDASGTNPGLNALGFLPVLIAAVVAVSMAARGAGRRFAIVSIGYAAAIVSTAYWWWGGQFIKPLTMIIEGEPFKNRPPLTLLLITMPVLSVALISLLVVTLGRGRISRLGWGVIAGLGYLAGGIPDLVLGGIEVGTVSFNAYFAAAVLTGLLVTLLAPPLKRRNGGSNA